MLGLEVGLVEGVGVGAGAAGEVIRGLGGVGKGSIGSRGREFGDCQHVAAGGADWVGVSLALGSERWERGVHNSIVNMSQELGSSQQKEAAGGRVYSTRTKSQQ